jgi:uncharacterized membrane protein
LVRAFVVAAIGWPIALGAVVWVQAAGDRPLWAVAIYAACSFVCHQIPERSFHTAGVQWPVCARCAGLYLSAPAGALFALWSLHGRPTVQAASSAIRLVAIAAVPTATTLALEWAGLAAPSNVVRAVAALPLGAAIAFVMVRAVSGSRKAIE